MRATALTFIFAMCERPTLWQSCLAVGTIAFLVRLAPVLANHPQPLLGVEPINIAVSLATTGRYADAFGAGVGPTAHTAPLHPLLLSLLIRWFGTGSDAALALSILSSGAASIAFALVPLLSVDAALGRVPGLLGGLAGALLPINFWAQTNGGFDAPLTAAALIALCILVSRFWRSRDLSPRRGIPLGIAAGLACLLNPVLLLVLCAWAVILVIHRRHSLAHVVRLVGVAALSLLLVLLPWALRNYRALGSPIWTRSNLGLELQVSNNDVMTADFDRNVHMPELRNFHPLTGPAQAALVRELGEVAYQRAKLNEALRWIATHKPRFLRLTIERVRLFWFPAMSRRLQSIAQGLLTILALAGLAHLLHSRHPFAPVLAMPAAAFPLIYYLIQVSPRYRFPLEPLLFLFAGYVVSLALARIMHTPSLCADCGTRVVFLVSLALARIMHTPSPSLPSRGVTEPRP